MIELLILVSVLFQRKTMSVANEGSLDERATGCTDTVNTHDGSEAALYPLRDSMSVLLNRQGNAYVQECVRY